MLHSMIFAPVASILLASALVNGQQCYYPDGSSAPDVPCNSSAPVSACCTSFGFCLANGLCLDSGVLSRGSCTDKEWQSDSCAQYCKNDNPSGGFGLMSCSNSTFTCGFFPDNCRVQSSTFSIDNADDLILRSSQLTSMMEAAGIDQRVVANATNGTLPSSDKEYTAAAMAGVGVGIGVPLLAVIAILSFLLVRDRRRIAAIKDDTLTSLRPPKGHEMSSWSTWNEPGGDAKRRQSTRGAAELSPETVQELETPLSTHAEHHPVDVKYPPPEEHTSSTQSGTLPSTLSATVSS